MRIRWRQYTATSVRMGMLKPKVIFDVANRSDMMKRAGQKPRKSICGWEAVSAQRTQLQHQAQRQICQSWPISPHSNAPNWNSSTLTLLSGTLGPTDFDITCM